MKKVQSVVFLSDPKDISPMVCDYKIIDKPKNKIIKTLVQVHLDMSGSEMNNCVLDFYYHDISHLLLNK